MTFGSIFTFTVCIIIFVLMFIGLYLLFKDIFISIKYELGGSTLFEIIFMLIIFIIGLIITCLTWWVVIQLFKLLFIGG